MRSLDRRLPRHLAFAIAVKLLLLAGMWWFLVRDLGVDADTEQTAEHLLAPTAANATASGTPP
jgi:hypothetical protein